MIEDTFRILIALRAIYGYPKHIGEAPLKGEVVPAEQQVTSIASKKVMNQTIASTKPDIDVTVRSSDDSTQKQSTPEIVSANQPTSSNTVITVTPSVEHPHELIHFSEYLSKPKGEDRIIHGIFSERHPYLIVADGVTMSESSDDKVYVGNGGRAAEEASIAAREHLEKTLPQANTIEDVLKCLRDTYEEVKLRLGEKNVYGGATTLLIAFLWAKDENSARFWCYSYEGDGFITIISSKHLVDKIAIAQTLLSPQKAASTAAISSRGWTVPPAVGCRAYEPGDLLYAASDGIVPLAPWLLKEENIALNHFFIKGAPEELQKRVKEILGRCKTRDDAVIGIIWPLSTTASAAAQQVSQAKPGIVEGRESSAAQDVMPDQRSGYCPNSAES